MAKVKFESFKLHALPVALQGGKEGGVGESVSGEGGGGGGYFLCNWHFVVRLTNELSISCNNNGKVFGQPKLKQTDRQTNSHTSLEKYADMNMQKKTNKNSSSILIFLCFFILPLQLASSTRITSV